MMEGLDSLTPEEEALLRQYVDAAEEQPPGDHPRPERTWRT